MMMFPARRNKSLRNQIWEKVVEYRKVIMSVSPKKIDLILVDVQQAMCRSWKEYFHEYQSVSIINGRFERVKEYDCLVSPANAYGLMDGGIDLAIRNYFGMGLQYAVHKVIQKEYFGEQPVGTSFVVYTGNEEYPFLAHTPTMRVPTDIRTTQNVYEAMFAMLRAVANFNKNNGHPIKKVLCPGLGTQTGSMDFAEAARQMHQAYKNFNNPTTNLNWKHLHEKHFEIMGKRRSETI